MKKKDKEAKLNNIELNNIEENISPYNSDSKNFNINVEKYGTAPTSITFDIEDKEVNSIINKLMNNEVTNEEIQKFVSDMNDRTIKAVLDAIDKTIENARKIMEQNKIYYEKVERPKLEMLKKLLQQELIFKTRKIKKDNSFVAFQKVLKIISKLILSLIFHLHLISSLY
ncbi:MAG: hypothetical protein KatS3mg068_1786 [Candidatus Sericytochromatia bacterium]|nr:MAG: hypothetical protein KatS3mg068_1786 [Candidatus Sericytochromatia bacterium]